MHPVERCLMWSVIVFIIFFLVFRQTSGYTMKGTSFFDLAEFKYYPQEMINAMKKDVNDVLYEAGNKLTPEWNSLPEDRKRNGLAAWAKVSSQAIENIRTSPKVLSEFGVPPPPPPLKQDPYGMRPVPMSSPPYQTGPVPRQDPYKQNQQDPYKKMY